MTLRTDGYPAWIAPQRQLVTLMLRDVQQKWPNAIYHVFYDGEGEIDFAFDSSVIEKRRKGKMKIKVSLSLVSDNGVFMKIKKTNPLNPLRNIRIIPDGHQETYEQEPFHPLFLEGLSKFKTIRFMPWTAEENVVKWEDRVMLNGFAAGRGVAFEHMIHLCNKLATNAWITVPYGADDDFVERMAMLFRDSLRKDLKIYVEYTNEAWNSLFNSGKFTVMMGKKLNFSQDETQARNLFYAARSKQIITIWKRIFGLEEENRLVLVLASFVLLPEISTRILTFQNASKSHSQVMLAVTGYFSCASPSSTFISTLTDFAPFFTLCKNDTVPIMNLLRRHLTIANNFNVGLGMYESGGSIMELDAIMSGHETPGATEKYIAINRDPRMYQVLFFSCNFLWLRIFCSVFFGRILSLFI